MVKMMRTIQQHIQQEALMKSKFKIAAQSRRAALVEDALGAISLFVLLFAALGLSGPF
jgi:hypothetical protein